MTANGVLSVLSDVTRRIVDNYSPQKVILFGSWAWGKPNADSDVDLFVVKETDDVRKTARAIDGSIFPRPFPMDIIVYTPGQVKKMEEAGDFFIKDILTKGKILYAAQ
ncbi:MAG: nucleotidyltransferase domain-containing protein [Patescibacteria group bacterium]